MDALDDMLKALYTVYGDAGLLMDPRTAHLVVDGHRLLSRQAVPGVEIRAEEATDATVVDVAVSRGVAVQNPVHTCIGLLAPRGTQRIRMRVRLEPGASTTLVAHCLFPNAEAARHEMDAEIDVGEDAELRYSEGHYHGPSGGIDVRPRVVVRVGPHGRFVSDFSLTTGRVGRLQVDYRVETAAYAVAEITTRVFGHGADEIRVRDELILAGRASRGLIKTRVAVEDEAKAEVVSITHGQAEGARGHMDCLELVRDRAETRTEPIIHVTHSLAKVTHEAAVGTVDQKQLETLMARGLTPEQAVDLIVTAMLR